MKNIADAQTWSIQQKIDWQILYGSQLIDSNVLPFIKKRFPTIPSLKSVKLMTQNACARDTP